VKNVGILKVVVYHKDRKTPKSKKKKHKGTRIVRDGED